MSEKLFHKVAEVIARYKKIPIETLTLDTTLSELGMDSLDGLSLIFELEESFNITVSDDEAAKFQNIRDIVESLERREIDFA